jgi:tetratricopeptide (TPR) repeat protein
MAVPKGFGGSKLPLQLEEILQLQNAGNLTRAEAEYLRLIKEGQGSSLVYTNLGNILQKSGRLEESLDYYRRALAEEPNHPQIHCNIAITLQELGRMDEALAAYQRSIQLKPDYATARTNLAMLQLLIQDFERGWADYEQRFNCPNMRLIEPPNLPKWDGGKSFNGQLVLVAEQGLGDSMQFARYAKVLQKSGLRISLQVDPKLVPLLATMDPKIEIYEPEHHYRATVDRWYPLMSLPHLLKTTVTTIPAEVPYLFGDKERVSYWQEKLKTTSRLKLAVAWQGNPRVETGSVKGRSFELEELEKIASLPGVELVSLQKFYGSEQWESCGFRDRFTACQPEINESTNFVDTAAILLCCDILLTADTSIAHLAGALGVQTWVVLKKIPEWRWMLNRFDSPWYPTMRLFRQKQRGIWSGAFADIYRDLEKLIATKTQQSEVRQ